MSNAPEKGRERKGPPLFRLEGGRKEKEEKDERRSWKNERRYWIRTIFHLCRKIRPPECHVKGLLFLFAYNLIRLSKTPVVGHSRALQKETAFSSDFLLIIYRIGARFCCTSLVPPKVITVHICTYAQLQLKLYGILC